MLKVGAIVLGAGGSRRLGQAKQLLEWRGESLVRRAVKAALEVGCGPVVVVLGAEHEMIAKAMDDIDIEIVVNDEWERGIGSSIRSGIEKLIAIDSSIQNSVLMLCDQPLVTRETIRRLLNEHERAKKSVTVSTYAETIGPPVVLNAEHFRTLRNLPADRGAKVIWEGMGEEMVHQVPAPECALDIDTDEDWKKLRHGKRL